VLETERQDRGIDMGTLLVVTHHRDFFPFDVYFRPTKVPQSHNACKTSTIEHVSTIREELNRQSQRPYLLVEIEVRITLYFVLAMIGSERAHSLSGDDT